MSGTKGMTHYSLETKLLAVQLHEREGLTYAEVAEQLEIRKPDRIEAWYRDYRREGELAFHKHIGRPPKQQQPQRNTGKITQGECTAKKIPLRIATSYAREAQYRVIEHYRGTYPVSEMCSFFGISRAAYYAWRKRMDRPDPDQERLQQVLEAYAGFETDLWLPADRDLVEAETRAWSSTTRLFYG